MPEKLNSECSSWVTLVSTICASASSSEETRRKMVCYFNSNTGSLCLGCMLLYTSAHLQSRGRTAATVSCWGSKRANCERPWLLWQTAAAFSRCRHGRPEELLHREHLVSVTLGSPNEHAGKAFLPSISILKTSFVTGKVVPRTRAENRKVQIGSAALYSGCEEHKRQK